MKSKKAVKVLGLFLAGILLFSSCADNEKTGGGTENKNIKVKDSEWTVCAGISKNDPEVNIESVESLEFKNTSAENWAVLVRMPLPAGITSEEIVAGTLRVKQKSGDALTLKASAVTRAWDRLDVNWNELEGSLWEAAASTSKKEEDGWYRMDVTEIIKKWLQGDIGQYGFLLEAIEEGTQASFFSSYDNPKECPELLLTYRSPESKESKENNFDYIAQEQGNCLSFALRDKTPIFSTDLKLDEEHLQSLYQEKGLNATADYIEAMALKYIDANREALQIKQIRKLSAFDESIDKEKEYRISTRIGAAENPDGSISFDYHWQAQLPDGSWAEKFGASASRIVPGSNRNLDPGRFPWDQNEAWGSSKWTEFYNSKVSYFAVEKEPSAFTRH